MIAKAYIDRRFIGLMSDIESNNDDNVIAFIWEHVQNVRLNVINYRRY